MQRKSYFIYYKNVFCRFLFYNLKKGILTFAKKIKKTGVENIPGFQGIKPRVSFSEQETPLQR